MYFYTIKYHDVQEVNCDLQFWAVIVIFMLWEWIPSRYSDVSHLTGCCFPVALEWTPPGSAYGFQGKKLGQTDMLKCWFLQGILLFSFLLELSFLKVSENFEE